MAVLQALKGKWKTFGELCDAIFNSMLQWARRWNATRIDLVSDRYPAISIKNPERNKRADRSGIQKIHVYNKEQQVQKQWKKYLSCGENKESLIVFLCNHLCDCISLWPKPHYVIRDIQGKMFSLHMWQFGRTTGCLQRVYWASEQSRGGRHSSTITCKTCSTKQWKNYRQIARHRRVSSLYHDATFHSKRHILYDWSGKPFSINCN